MSTEAAKSLLRAINAKYPDPMTVSPETDELFELRDEGLIYQWDSWPDGRRRWMATHEGQSLLATSGKDAT